MQIVLDELPAGGLAVHAGQHAGVGRRVDDHVDRRAASRSRTRRRMSPWRTRTPSARKAAAVALAAGPDEVVDARGAVPPCSTHSRISVEPTKPQAPVTRIFTKRACAARPPRSRAIVCSSVTRDVPRRIVRAHLPQVAVVADVIADAVARRRSCSICGWPVKLLDQLERLEDRAGVGLPAAEVVDLAAARARRRTRAMNRATSSAVDVVADLFALVAENPCTRGLRDCTSPGS